MRLLHSLPIRAAGLRGRRNNWLLRLLLSCACRWHAGRCRLCCLLQSGACRPCCLLLLLLRPPGRCWAGLAVWDDNHHLLFCSPWAGRCSRCKPSSSFCSTRCHCRCRSLQCLLNCRLRSCCHRRSTQWCCYGGVDRLPCQSCCQWAHMHWRGAGLAVWDDKLVRLSLLLHRCGFPCRLDCSCGRRCCCCRCHCCRCLASPRTLRAAAW